MDDRMALHLGVGNEEKSADMGQKGNIKSTHSRLSGYLQWQQSRECCCTELEASRSHVVARRGREQGSLALCLFCLNGNDADFLQSP